jgi:hypothetical protein
MTEGIEKRGGVSPIPTTPKPKIRPPAQGHMETSKSYANHLQDEVKKPPIYRPKLRRLGYRPHHDVDCKRAFDSDTGLPPE